MTTLLQVLIRPRPFSGSLDPRYPLGLWLASVSITGDATGGDKQASVMFASAFQEHNRNFYSLEQIGMQDGSPVDQRASMSTDNMDSDGSAPLTHQITLDMLTNEGGNSAITPAASEAIRGLFLGRQRLAGQVAQLNFRLDNVNTVILDVSVQGYYWGPRSILAPGGLQRPPLGLYRS